MGMKKCIVVCAAVSTVLAVSDVEFMVHLKVNDVTMEIFATLVITLHKWCYSNEKVHNACLLLLLISIAVSNHDRDRDQNNINKQVWTRRGVCSSFSIGICAPMKIRSSFFRLSSYDTLLPFQSVDVL